jgi:hypothetical protein
LPTVLELYFGARAGNSALARAVLATGLAVLTLLMTVGILGFGMFSQMTVSGAPFKLPS